MTTSKNGFLPNSFQVPNLYLDRVMPLLELSEFAVLMYAARHILGWDDVQDRCAHLSLTAFERGHRGQSGCGLSRPVIKEALDRLEEFGLLERVGKPSSRKGQAWKLVLDESAVKWDQMQARRDEKEAKNHKRTRPATKASIEKREAEKALAVRPTYQDSSTLDVPIAENSSTLDVPVSGTSHVPISGTSDVLIRNTREIPGKEKPTDASHPPGAGETTSETVVDDAADENATFRYIQGRCVEVVFSGNDKQFGNAGKIANWALCRSTDPTWQRLHPAHPMDDIEFDAFLLWFGDKRLSWPRRPDAWNQQVHEFRRERDKSRYMAQARRNRQPEQESTPSPDELLMARALAQEVDHVQ